MAQISVGGDVGGAGGEARYEEIISILVLHAEGTAYKKRLFGLKKNDDVICVKINNNRLMLN